METYSIPVIVRDVFYVGAKDWNRQMFDALIPLPQCLSCERTRKSSSHRYREPWFRRGVRKEDKYGFQS